MSHTPGPWRVAEYNSEGGDNDVIDSCSRLIAEVNEWGNTSPSPNAALIAAAPETAAERDQLKDTNKELLDVLESLLNYTQDIASEREEYPICIERALRVISKAKGALK